MDLLLADQAYVEGGIGGAEIICKNMFPAPKPAIDGRQYELKSCAGLEVFASLEDSLRDFISVVDLFNGDIFAVAGGQFLRISSNGTVTKIGSVPTTGVVTMAATRTQIGVCVAPNFYIYNGTTFAQVTDEDLPNVYSVTALYQRFILSDENDRTYWTDILAGESVDGLNFFTAESSPDRLKRVFSDGEKYYAMGADSIEVNGAVTNPASDANAFARIGSGVIKSGLAGVHAVAVDVDSLTVAFLGSQRTIYITQGYEPTVISTPYIETVLENATEEQIALARCFAYREAGETFFVLNVPNVKTFVFGKRLQKWHLRETFGSKTWRANMHVRAFGQEYVASTTDKKIWRMSRDIKTDDGLIISKEFSASSVVRERGTISSIIVDGYADGDCVISMRTRKSAAQRIWGSWVDRSLQSPDNLPKALWRRLGKVLPHEFIAHFRITDSVSVNITGIRANDGGLR